MSYPKIKKESYSNIGGINTKASVYVTGDREVLDLVNYDLTVPGAWTPRLGMTNGIPGNTLALGASNRLNFGFQVMTQPQPVLGSSGVTYKQMFVGNSGLYSLIINDSTYRYADENLTGATHPLISTDGRGNALSIMNGGGSVGFFSANGMAYKFYHFGGVYYYGLPLYPIAPSMGQTGVGVFTGTYNFKISYADSLGYDGASSGTLTYTVTGSSGAFAINFSGLTMTEFSIKSNAVTQLLWWDRDPALPGSWALGQNFGTTSAYSVSNLISGSRTYPGETIYNSTSSFSYESLFLEDNVEVYSSRLFWLTARINNKLKFTEPIETSVDMEAVFPENFLLLPNQDFPAIGQKAFNQTLMVFNQKGVTRITGNSNESFQAVELTRQYGLIGSRAIIEWNERLWFLDEKDIVEYDGANFKTVSERVESILARMNKDEAPKCATAIHYSDRNEVWFAIPIDGSSQPNIILVYNYLVDGWTTFKSIYSFNALTQVSTPDTLMSNAAGFSLGINIASYKQTYKGLFISSSGGSFVFFDPNSISDNGSRYTLSFRTNFHAEQGHSVTNEWRRLYLDNGPWTGTTLPFQVNFYANFYTGTISLTKTMYFSGSQYSGQQQTRLDFGIPAKSLSIEVIYGNSMSMQLAKIYGYTVERRFLRNV